MQATHFLDHDSTWNQATTAVATDNSIGVVGDSIPYSIGADSTLTTIIMACTIFTFIFVAKSQRFFSRQFRHIFFMTHNHESNTETSTELRLQLLMTAITCLLMAIISYDIAKEFIAPRFIIVNDYLLIAIMLAMFMTYYVAKWTIAAIVNITFFGGKKNLQYWKVQLFIATCQGVLILPIALLLTYFNFTVEKVFICLCFVLFLNKIITFYSDWSIFFKQNRNYLQTFLYFCALEITPLLAFAGIWLMTIDFLKINF